MALRFVLAGLLNLGVLVQTGDQALRGGVLGLQPLVALGSLPASGLESGENITAELNKRSLQVQEAEIALRSEGVIPRLLLSP